MSHWKTEHEILAEHGIAGDAHTLGTGHEGYCNLLASRGCRITATVTYRTAERQYVRTTTGTCDLETYTTEEKNNACFKDALRRIGSIIDSLPGAIIEHVRIDF
jgi:hypothetical protein